jgi:palmitoyltransferase
MLNRIADGRTDLVFDFPVQGHAADSADARGVWLIPQCAYHGDVRALRYLVSRGASLAAPGENPDLNGPVFHGHRQSCEFLIERGADVNHPQPGTGETPLHSALRKISEPRFNLVLKVLMGWPEATPGSGASAVRPGG